MYPNARSNIDYSVRSGAEKSEKSVKVKAGFAYDYGFDSSGDRAVRGMWECEGLCHNLDTIPGFGESDTDVDCGIFTEKALTTDNVSFMVQTTINFTAPQAERR